MVNFCIIIPSKNSAQTILRALASVSSQSSSLEINFRVILVDDGSTDQSKEIAIRYAQELGLPFMLLENTTTHVGPGLCRNLAIDISTVDEYLLFLDSDDLLCPLALITLAECISKNHPEIISFNYTVAQDYGQSYWAIHFDDLKGEAKDHQSLLKSKGNLILDYLSMKMNGSAIYTCFSSDFLKSSSIRFRSGLHEDIDFMYACYLSTTTVSVVPQVLYIKCNRPGSIVNTISVPHIHGYLCAWEQISALTINYNTDLIRQGLSMSMIWTSLDEGIRGAIAVLMHRTIHLTDSLDSQSAANLIATVVSSYPNLCRRIRGMASFNPKTTYDKISMPVILLLCS